MPVSLIADDEPAVRRFISEILQQEHFHTLEAENGSQALRMVQELDGKVDLIVSDIQMPNGDGLSLARAVKDAYPAVRIILISGQPTPDASFEFVKKPFLSETLVKAVRKMERARAQAAG